MVTSKCKTIPISPETNKAEKQPTSIRYLRQVKRDAFVLEHIGIDQSGDDQAIIATLRTEWSKQQTQFSRYVEPALRAMIMQRITVSRATYVAIDPESQNPAHRVVIEKRDRNNLLSEGFRNPGLLQRRKSFLKQNLDTEAILIDYRHAEVLVFWWLGFAFLVSLAGGIAFGLLQHDVPGGLGLGSALLAFLVVVLKLIKCVAK